MKKKLAVLLSAALLALGVPVGLGASAADFVPDFLCTYPAEGSELEMEAFDISWEPVDGAVKYQVNLKNTDTGEYVLELAETNGTSISAPMDGLQQKGAGNYIVAVSAELADGSKKYSSRPTFTIKEPAEKQYFIGGAKVVAFGDSLVANGWEEEWSPVWANMLWQRFGFAELVNAGVPGNTTTQGLARFDTDVAVHSDADFVLIVDVYKRQPSRGRTRSCISMARASVSGEPMRSCWRRMGGMPACTRRSSVSRRMAGRIRNKTEKDTDFSCYYRLFQL